MSATRCSLVFICLVLLAATTSAGSNRPPKPKPVTLAIPNGGFENGTTDPFALHPDTEGQVLPSFGTIVPSEGGHFCHLDGVNGHNGNVGIETASFTVVEHDCRVSADVRLLFSEVPSAPIHCTMTSRVAGTGQILATQEKIISASTLQLVNSPQNGLGFSTELIVIDQRICIPGPTDIIVDVAVSVDGLNSGDMACLVDNFVIIPIVSQFDCEVKPKLESFAPWQNAPCG